MTCDLFDRVHEYCLAEALFDGVKTLCVGVSGGADSVCLLDVLTRLAPEFGLSLRAVHVHHGLRGAEADRDAAFVKALCDTQNVSVQLVRSDAAATARDRRCSVEEAGRDLRYAAFRAAGCDAVAVAHTMNDNIETMLFHLARGTSLTGFAGMRPKNGDVLRPLLCVRRDEVEQYLKERALTFVTDSTNQSDDYTRNRIRHRAVPALKEINPAFLGHAAALMCDAREEDECLNEQAKALLLRARTDAGYRKDVLLETHPAVQKKALHLLLCEAMPRCPERSDLTRCLQVLHGDRVRTQLSGNLFFARRRGAVFTMVAGEPARPTKDEKKKEENSNGNDR